ncbi:MAG: copper resistance protein CopD, partial [candidate division NC10 bacterium]
METLGGLLSVVLRGFGLAALAVSTGGVAFALLVLGPLGAASALARRALGRTLRLIIWGGVGVASAQFLLLIVQSSALADENGVWPLREFLTIGFARVGLIRISLGAALAVAAWRLRRRGPSKAAWTTVTALALLLGGSSAWLSHAMGRLDNRGVLMALDAL